MRKAEPNAAAAIDILVNTHANGDHIYGNELVNAGEIIATKACAEEFNDVPPQMMADILAAAPGMGELGRFFKDNFDSFNFQGITLTPPTKTFEGRLDIEVGNRNVSLIQVGPCHTKGDMIVWEPEGRVVFAGDILFINGTPIMWAGPVDNWFNALDTISGLKPEVIVPGHGPITDQTGLDETRAYFEYLVKEGEKRFKAGQSVNEASRELIKGDYSHWGDPERVAINLDTLYRQFGNDPTPANAVELFSIMAEITAA
jgi:glyoxylase-like metal-dependent hydrolase (beta-lactamase superfamily II)